MGQLHIMDIDRAFDLRVLAAIPPTLGLFAPGSLEAQLREMARQRRAICFTVISPIETRRHPMGAAGGRIATVLVCLHVAPELATCGVDLLTEVMKRTVESDPNPVHELSTPFAHIGGNASNGCYREAVYADRDVSVAVTTHTPVELPAETRDAVAVVTRGAAVDIVTTIAVTPWRSKHAAGLRAAGLVRPTTH